MILFLLLCSRAAQAGTDAPSQKDMDTTDSAPSGILDVPVGSTITTDKKTINVITNSFLLPESYYDQALIKATQLNLCQAQLTTTSAVADQALSLSTKTIAACGGQLTEEGSNAASLQNALNKSELSRQAAEARLGDVRHQRNVAWAITGGLVLGAAAISVVAVDHIVQAGVP